MAAVGAKTHKDRESLWRSLPFNDIAHSGLLVAIAVGLAIALALSRHIPVSAPAQPLPPASVLSPVIQSARAAGACSSYNPGLGGYLVGAFDSGAEKLTAWGRKMLPGLGSQSLPWKSYPPGMYVAMCIYGNDEGFPTPGPRGHDLPDRLAVAVGANGLAQQITFGSQQSLPPTNPAP